MNINEIRIGNWVKPRSHFWSEKSVKYAVWGTVRLILKDELSFDRWPVTHIKDVEELNLNEEWLSAFAFRSIRTDDVSISPATLWIPPKTKEPYLIEYDEKPGAFFDVKYNNRIRYVHQLQNRYFNESGEELSITI